MKRQKKQLVTCEYCGGYQESEKRYSNGTVRVCKTINKEVTGNKEACTEFHIHAHFWCDKDSNRLHIEICGRRPCKCNQKKIIVAGKEHTARFQTIDIEKISNNSEKPNGRSLAKD